jgi:hypothetical protein
VVVGDDPVSGQWRQPRARSRIPIATASSEEVAGEGLHGDRQAKEALTFIERRTAELEKG